jgi:hypothetical protein
VDDDDDDDDDNDNNNNNNNNNLAQMELGRLLTRSGLICLEEMNYMRKTAEYTRRDDKTNTKSEKELNITPVLDKIQEYRRNRLRLETERPQ